MCTESQLACACGRHYDVVRWNTLPLCASFTTGALCSRATPRPADLLVEIRVCTNCERQITRLTDSARASERS